MRAPRSVVVALAALVVAGAAGCTPSSAPAPPAPGSPTSTSGLPGSPFSSPSPSDAGPTPTSPSPPATPPTSPSPPASPPTATPLASPAPSVDPPPAPSSTTPGDATSIPAAWRGVDVERLPTDERVVALTFDGGSSDAGVASVLDTLDRYGVAATFFVTGAFARTYPDSVRAIVDAGHPVGNHSDTHAHYPQLRNDEIRADLAAAEASITDVTGRAARPLFRFPYGDRTPADIAVVNAAGYVPVRWTVDSLGWRGTSGGLSAGDVADRVLAAAVPGQIVLLHVGANPDDGTTLDAAALPDIIEGLRERGYAFVDLSDLVG